MKILLVNDDGYGAEGMEALLEQLSARHEVTVVAPDSQRSGAGHSVTLSQPIRARRMPRGYAISGTPADCVKLGVNYLCRDCDLVVSGINPGANLGVDCNYSGTASAAREAAMQGRQALAASCYCREFADVRYLAQITAQVIEAFLRNPLPAGSFLNLNMPNLTRGDAVRLRAAPMGWFTYEEDYIPVEGEEGEIYFQLNYGRPVQRQAQDDLHLVRSGFVTLTPVTWDATDRAHFSTAQEIADKMKDAGKPLA